MRDSSVLNVPGGWSANGCRLGPTPGMFRERPELGNYGDGMPYGALYSYVIKPLSLVVGNVVSETTLTNEAQWVPLNTEAVLTDEVVTFYYGDGPIPYGSSPSDLPPQMQNGQILTLQFQYPCCLTVTASDDLGTDTFVIFGYDGYGNPMQVGTTAGSDTTTAAFYGVTGVWYDGTLAEDATVTISTSQTYGLPFCLASTTQIVQYSETGAWPGVVPGVAFVPANTPSASEVPDVRGTVTAVTVDGSTESVTTYYVEGGDPQQAVIYQTSLGGNPSGLPSSFVSGSPLVFSNLIGELPFYVGHP